MLISHKHKFIFVHVPKVAGTSMRQALRRSSFQPHKLPWNRLLKKVNILSAWPYKSHHAFHKHHVRAYELRNEFSADVFDTYYTFGFVRNPWDRVVSLYNYIRRRPKHPHYSAVRTLPDFKAYVNYVAQNSYPAQAEFLCDDSNSLLVDFVGRYENLTTDFAAVCQKIRISANLPHKNASVRVDYRTAYNDRTREIVGQVFRRDIELFGYRFDERAIAA